MSRLPRVIVPNVPLHITQRGVDRRSTFVVDEDFAFYHWALREALVEADCAVHAYVLMSNHVHLLTTPADPGGPARMMRSVGIRYVRYFNDRYRRTGTLWEGRYRSALVDSAPYFFACSRYIEMNPVRASIVADARAYEWSSVHYNACGRDDAVVNEHAQYTSLGGSRQARCTAYHTMLAMTPATPAVAALRAAQCGRSRICSTPYQQAVDAVESGIIGESGS